MRIFLAAIACLFATSAGALTVTFDHNPTGETAGGDTLVGESQGFHYLYDLDYLSGRHIALHDDSGILETAIYAQNGAHFTPHDIDLVGYSRVEMTGDGAAREFDGSPEVNQWAMSGTPPIPYLTFTGLRDGHEVASQVWDILGASNMAFSSAFANIDRLLISLSIPQTFVIGVEPSDILQPNTAWCFFWCAEYQMDNLEVTLNPSPVPLPASLPMFLIGLAGLGFVARSRVKKH